MKFSERVLHFFFHTVILLLYFSPSFVSAQDVTNSDDSKKSFSHTSGTVLAPVYGPLAEQIVMEYNLADKEGIGIDIGGGPGDLVVELCKRTTRMHWINADINPKSFPHLSKIAAEADMGHRISMMFADAQELPFRDDYADIVVSRGSFHFWDDKLKAFSEIYRVLKPGGVAYIGRGFSDNLPVDIARKIRRAQEERGNFPKYDVAETARNLEHIMKSLEIKEYSIRIPRPPGSEGVNYGVWVEFHKPEAE
jgi:SAM-dependent methyltransferase